ncbi:hypothetical protein PR048_012999 [Dryococelus australis]|uniref:Double jelly roll-like domain-containing protein n=1 Tax=Dryococelus australis TaxID=614101 RepID=A0ABQ9HQX1_9NEOP|nr:hypothetical protein PR048_012999 [Dryococelus australis]
MAITTYLCENVRTNVIFAMCRKKLETNLNVPQTMSINYNMKTTLTCEKLHYIIIAFKTGKPFEIRSWNIRNMKMHLKFECYPYGDLVIDFANRICMVQYKIYAYFQRVYYGQTQPPMITLSELMNTAPLLVLDVSKQYDRIQTSVIDCRIELTAPVNCATNTQAYTLIIHN